MSDILANILLKKYQEKSLASLYLITYDPDVINPETWVLQFCKNFTPLTDHPDILKVHKDEKSNDYKVDSMAIKGFLKFINYRPLKLEKKFIFLFDAEDLSVIVSNKLLKVFEELGSDYCLMLMAPDNASLLPTVLSRAVKLKIASDKGMALLNEINFNDIKTPQDFIASLKRASDLGANYEKKFIESIIEQKLKAAASKAFSVIELEEFLVALKNYETTKAFNNAQISRIASVFR